jgi:hypothetical protein
MTDRARGPGAYARALENALSRIRERPVVLSPRDWSLVVDWHRREIPLAVVLEVLDEAASRSRSRTSGAGPRSLAYIAPAVEEAWKLILSGRRDHGAPAPAVIPTLQGVRDAWERAAAAAGRDSKLHGLLVGLLGRLDRGEAAAVLDDELDRGIAECCPPAEVEGVEREVEAELTPFRSRIPARSLAGTRCRSVAARLRRARGIPRLSVTAPPE